MQRLFTEKETAAYLRLSQATLKSWRRNNAGPAYLKLGRAVRYDKATLDAFLQANAVEVGGAM